MTIDGLRDEGTVRQVMANWLEAGEARRSGEPGSATPSTGSGEWPSARRGPGELSRDTLDQITRAIQSVVYGQVVILVQDGRVVQIDRTEKVRLR